MGIFNTDGKMMRSFGKVIDIICLSFLFLVSCIPVVTVGAAATALYYTVNKVIKNDRGYIFREYVSAFKENFKKTTLVWLLVLLLSCVLGADMYILQAWGESGSKIGVLSIVVLVIGAFFAAWALYLFAYMARFENTIRQIMKNAFFIELVHLPWTIVLIGMLFGFSLLVYMLPVSLVFVPGLFTLLENLILEKIFWKYMSEEDREAERERNQNFKN